MMATIIAGIADFERELLLDAWTPTAPPEGPTAPAAPAIAISAEQQPPTGD
jgi:hypothetical protein